MSLNPELFELVANSRMASSSQADLELIDQRWQKLIEKQPHDREIVFQYNEFRVSNCSKLPKTRPRILLGGPFNIRYPNQHSFPLFQVADVVCLTCFQDNTPPLPFKSALYCTPAILFFDILKRLPQGFVPDFYWDNQVEHTHFVPYGIEQAPFPIVASVCHTFLHQSVENVCTVFDRVIAMSKFHAEILRKKFPDKILEMPFGLNWGSFDALISPKWDKTIDVFVAFQQEVSPIYCNHRNRIMELIRRFKEKHGDRFKIEIHDSLSPSKYIEMLQNSRITINATGIHGPYNYRSVEAMCAGSLLLQYDWSDDPFYRNDFSELFTEGVHGASFNFNNFESKLLYYLEHKEETEKIAHAGLAFLKEKYSYKVLYENLIKMVLESDISTKRSTQKTGYHHVDMIYYWQNNVMIDYVTLSVINEAAGGSWTHLNNLMVLSGMWSERNPGYYLLISLLPAIISEMGSLNLWEITCKLYKMSLAAVPEEHSWIVHWNFLMVAIDNEKASLTDMEGALGVLEKALPRPFEEKQIFFKYYLRAKRYEKYHAVDSNVEFNDFNLGLMKVIDMPQERANLYHDFSLRATRYFIEITKQ